MVEDNKTDRGKRSLTRWVLPGSAAMSGFFTVDVLLYLNDLPALLDFVYSLRGAGTLIGLFGAFGMGLLGFFIEMNRSELEQLPPLVDKALHNFLLEHKKEIGEIIQNQQIPVLGQRNLKIGDDGNDVDEVQIKLAHVGFDIEIDGKFGKETEKAVIKFQEKNELTIDGIIGPETRQKLNQVLVG